MRHKKGDFSYFSNIFEIRLFLKMKSRLKHFATEIGEFVYDVEDNHISLAMTISSIPQEKQSLFGAVLFSRGITGARFINSEQYP